MSNPWLKDSAKRDTQQFYNNKPYRNAELCRLSFNVPKEVVLVGNRPDVSEDFQLVSDMLERTCSHPKCQDFHIADEE